MQKTLAVFSLLLAVLLLQGCGEPESWQPLRKLGDNWYYNDIHLGHRFAEYQGLPFVLQDKTVLDEQRTLHHYTLDGDSMRFGPIQAAEVTYTFNHNDILKDINLYFKDRAQYEETRKALIALFGAPQNTSGRAMEEWYYNDVMVALGWHEAQDPAGQLDVTLLTPCKNY